MPRLRLGGSFGLIALLLSGPGEAADADRHLRAGAAHFRSGRYDEAVVEFKVARALGAGNECPWYVAAALTRAGRHLDALEAFDEAEAIAASSSDALFLYYRGVACSELQLAVCASQSFELASASAGPKISELAQQLAFKARALLAQVPPQGAIDLLLARAAEQARLGRPRLVRVFAREAQALSSRREDRWREAEARQLAGALDAGVPLP